MSAGKELIFIKRQELIIPCRKRNLYPVRLSDSRQAGMTECRHSGDPPKADSPESVLRWNIESGSSSNKSGSIGMTQRYINKKPDGSTHPVTIFLRKINSALILNVRIRKIKWFYFPFIFNCSNAV